MPDPARDLVPATGPRLSCSLFATTVVPASSARIMQRAQRSDTLWPTTAAGRLYRLRLGIRTVKWTCRVFFIFPRSIPGPAGRPVRNVAGKIAREPDPERVTYVRAVRTQKYKYVLKYYVIFARHGRRKPCIMKRYFMVNAAPNGRDLIKCNHVRKIRRTRSVLFFFFNATTRFLPPPLRNDVDISFQYFFPFSSATKAKTFEQCVYG